MLFCSRIKIKELTFSLRKGLELSCYCYCVTDFPEDPFLNQFLPGLQSARKLCHQAQYIFILILHHENAPLLNNVSYRSLHRRKLICWCLIILWWALNTHSRLFVNVTFACQMQIDRRNLQVLDKDLSQRSQQDARNIYLAYKQIAFINNREVIILHWDIDWQEPIVIMKDGVIILHYQAQG